MYKDIKPMTSAALNKLTASQIVTAYNSLNGTNIKKFSSKKVGIEKLLKVMDGAEAADLIAAGVVTETQVEKKPRKASKKAANKKPAAKKASTPRVNKFAGKKIKLLVKDCPRREGTHGAVNWANYKNGITYETYIAKDGSHTKHLNWDIEKGFVELTD